MKIIPAIDIINGQCVRLAKGDFSNKTIYNSNPLNQAKIFEDAGLKYLHLVDLEGSREGEVVNWETIKDICRNTELIVDFGGGIRRKDDLERLFDLGVDQINVGSAAILNPDGFNDWMEVFGPEKIILSADVKERFIAINAWENKTQIDLFDFLSDQVSLNSLTHVCITDISKDGMLAGPSFDLYKEIILDFPKLDLIASGGVTQITDIDQLVAIGLGGVIIGKAIYEGHITLDKLSVYVN